MKTANHEYYVSLEVANLLKKAGFKWFINSAYRDGVLMHQGNLLCDNFNGKQYENAARHEFFSAPTLDIAQRWLREVKRKHIEASPENDEYTEWLFCIYNSDSIAYTGYKTYEEAIEAGIKKALETILEKGE